MIDMHRVHEDRGSVPRSVKSYTYGLVTLDLAREVAVARGVRARFVVGPQLMVGRGDAPNISLFSAGVGVDFGGHP
jgi:hypothetical protein